MVPTAPPFKPMKKDGKRLLRSCTIHSVQIPLKCQICQHRNNIFILMNGGLQVRKLVCKIRMNILIVFPWLLQCSAWHRNLYRQLEAVPVITLSWEVRDGLRASLYLPLLQDDSDLWQKCERDALITSSRSAKVHLLVPEGPSSVWVSSVT